MAKRRRMTAKQLKYFGKRRTRTVYIKTKTRRKGIMARRKGGYRRTVSRGIGGMKSFLPPILSGVADSYLDPMLPSFYAV